MHYLKYLNEYVAISITSFTVRIVAVNFPEVNLVTICILIMIPLTLISKIEKYHACCYLGAFLGMGRVLDPQFFISVLLLCGIYRLQIKLKINIGGKLGFMAYVSNQLGRIKWP